MKKFEIIFDDDPKKLKTTNNIFSKTKFLKSFFLENITTIFAKSQMSVKSKKAPTSKKTKKWDESLNFFYVVIIRSLKHVSDVLFWFCVCFPLHKSKFSMLLFFFCFWKTFFHTFLKAYFLNWSDLNFCSQSTFFFIFFLFYDSFDKGLTRSMISEFSDWPLRFLWWFLWTLFCFSSKNSLLLTNLVLFKNDSTLIQLFYAFLFCITFFQKGPSSHLKSEKAFEQKSNW